MDRDRSFESDKIIENIEEENLEENKTDEEYFEALIYYLQNQEEDMYTSVGSSFKSSIEV